DHLHADGARVAVGQEGALVDRWVIAQARIAGVPRRGRHEVVRVVEVGLASRHVTLPPFLALLRAARLEAATTIRTASVTITGADVRLWRNEGAAYLADLFRL